MNSKLISIIAVVVVVVGVGAFLLVGRPASAPSENNPAEIADNTANQLPNESNSGPATLQNLLRSGKAQKCTFSDMAEGNNSKGTFYISNGKARGDIDVVAGDQAINSHMIIDGQTSYIWSNAIDKGVKITMPDSPAPVADSQPGQFDANKTVDYKCENWIVDASLFIPPSTITFSDMSDLTAPALGTAFPSVVADSPVSDSAAKCAACDSAPAASREQCRTALGCN